MKEKQETVPDFYNVAHYAQPINVEARRAFRGTQLRVGHRAPDFRLPTVQPDGEVSLAEATARGPVALVFGCLSAPPCVRELPAINALAQSGTAAAGAGAGAGAGARIVFVYTREAHPGELLPAHHTMSQKASAARRLKEELGSSLTVAVDDLDGTTHRAYGGLPFMAVMVDRDGLVVHRSEWANAAQLAAVFDNLASFDAPGEGDLPHLVSYCETLWLMDGGTREKHEEVLRGAGEGALADARDGPPSQDLWA